MQCSCAMHPLPRPSPSLPHLHPFQVLRLHVDLERDHIFGAHEVVQVATMSPFYAIADLTVAKLFNCQWLVSSDSRGKFKVRA